MRALIRYFAERVIVSHVITLMVIFIGLGALTVIQRDNYPEVDFDEMVISTSYLGASPEDVELNITNKIEKSLKEVDGIDKTTSFSVENISIIRAMLDDKNNDSVKLDIRNAVSRVSDFPAEVKIEPLVEEISISRGVPIIEIGLSGGRDYNDLRQYAIKLERALRNVSGVARIEKFGYLDREIRIEVKQTSMERYHIALHEIVSAIRNRNIRSSGGSFESYTNEKNIVTLAQFNNPLEVSDVIVKINSDGSVVRVRDLAVIKDDFKAAKVLSRLNGKDAISFLVYKKKSADIIRTINSINAYIDRYKQNLPESVTINYSNDTSRIVRNRLEIVTLNGLMGLLLVLIVLALFLNFRSALWVAIGIPFVLLGVIFLLPVFGVYLDSISLGAMILVIGIIVDDGIVVAENIWFYREKGLSPIDAAVEGTISVFQPVLATIITTGLAFAPMFFMNGTLGEFVYVIPLVVILALGISLIEVTIVLPAHLIGGRHKHLTKNKDDAKDSFVFFITASFSKILSIILRWRYVVVSFFLLLLATSFWYTKQYMEFELFPTQSSDTIYMAVELPKGSSLQNTADKIKEIDRIIMSLPKNEVDSFVSRIGTNGGGNVGESENHAVLSIYLTPFSTRKRNADQITETIREAVQGIMGISDINFVIDSGGLPVGSPISLHILGVDDIQRSQLANEIVSILNEVEGVKDIKHNDKQGKEQVKINLDYLRLSDMDLNVADVAKAVRLAYDGEIVTSVRYGNEDVDFRVLLEEQVRSSINTLGKIIIPNRQGRFIELREIAHFKTVPGPSNFYHHNNERAISITADIIKGRTTSSKAIKAVMGRLDMEKNWSGMSLIIDGEAEETEKSMSSLIVVFILAAIGIYLVLLLLFNSLTQPLIVMAIIPFGIVGVIITFALHGQSMSFLAILGVIGLTGIIINDSLILTNLMNQIQRGSKRTSHHESLIKATQNRLRPILLTSITTVAGVLPMAYGIGGADPFLAPMALAMGYGILFATPLMLILLPCLLAIQSDLISLKMALSQKTHKVFFR